MLSISPSPRGRLAATVLAPSTVPSDTPKEVSIRQHPHPLFLTESHQYSTDGYTCDICKQQGNGASYHCVPCEFDAHVACVKTEDKKLDDVAAATKVQALYRGHSSRKLTMATEDDKKEIKSYLETRAKQRDDIRKHMKAFTRPVQDIIINYAEEHVALIPAVTGQFPLKFRLGAKTVLTVREYAGFTTEMSMTCAQARREIAKLVATVPEAVQIFRTTDQKELSAKSAVGDAVQDEALIIQGIVRRMYYRCGRPFGMGDGQFLMACERPTDEEAGQHHHLRLDDADGLALRKEIKSADCAVTAETGESEAAASVWSSSLPGLSANAHPDVDSLSPALRRQLAADWTHDALAEHASIASFARFTLQLMAVSAPPHLLHEAQKAAADEVRHARICFALASAYAGKSVEPGRFPIAANSIKIDTSLAAIAASTADEACIEETLSCLVLAEACARCEDPVVRTALNSLVRDEARHAALGWSTVAWALKTGGTRDSSVREHVSAIFQSELSKYFKQHADVTTVDSKTALQQQFIASELERSGRLSGPVEQSLRNVAMRLVISPWSQALLAGKAEFELSEDALKQLDMFAGAKAAVQLIAARCSKVCV